MILLTYIIFFNLPVLAIILYLFLHKQSVSKPEPIHFEKKPLS